MRDLGSGQIGKGKNMTICQRVEDWKILVLNFDGMDSLTTHEFNYKLSKAS